MEGHTHPDAAQREKETPGRGPPGPPGGGGGRGRDSGMGVPGPGGMVGAGWTDAATWGWPPEGAGQLAAGESVGPQAVSEWAAKR